VSVRATSSIDLDALIAQYLVDRSADLAPETIQTYMGYFSGLFVPRFATLASITENAMRQFKRDRLRKVSSSSLRKELSCMRGFLHWCKEEGYINSIPKIEDPKKRVMGTAACEKIRVDIDNDRAQKLIQALPEVSGRRKYPVRDLILFAWETALRRKTIRSLRCPENYTSGSSSLRIDGGIDKNRFARTFELSDVACEILDRHCDGEGLIWGTYDVRGALRKAAKAAGCFTEREIQHLSMHDLRHGALTEMATSSPNLPGIAHIAGHRNVGTTSLFYVHPKRDQARAVLNARPKIELVPEVVPGDDADERERPCG
jgi:integrase